jgi:predicted oxidoreductase
MKRHQPDTLQISRIIHGHWHLSDWKLSTKELLELTQQIVGYFKSSK